jgi:G3E family GTPase
MTVSLRVQVNDWMEDLVVNDFENLYRFKGVLAIAGWPDRFIFQACRHVCIMSCCCELSDLLNARRICHFALQ